MARWEKSALTMWVFFVLCEFRHRHASVHHGTEKHTMALIDVDDPSAHQASPQTFPQRIWNLGRLDLLIYRQYTCALSTQPSH
jgi:hypothetical protein